MPDTKLGDSNGAPDTKIGDSFRLLATNPQRALESAEILLGRYSKKTAHYVHVADLKTRALLQLHRTDDCLAFISSLQKEIQSDKRFLMSKGRALQTQGRFSEALSIFQHLYTAHRTTKREHKVHGLALGRLLHATGGAANLEQALAIYTQLRSQAAQGRENTPCDDQDIELTLGRHLQIMGGAHNLQKALAIYTRLRTQAARGRATPFCDDKAIELALAIHLQIMGGTGNLAESLTILTRLRAHAAGGQANRPCNDKEIELPLGRVLQTIGGNDNLKQALTIFTRLRTKAAGGKLDTPCDDKEIELALGRLLQIMGGARNQEQALAIFTRLRTKAARGKLDTPCDNKDIELTLGRQLQLIGGKHNLEKAQAIFTRLRTQAAGGQANTPCDDKDIELSLGRLLQIMGGQNNLEKARAIFTRLRAQAAGGQANTPCDDTEIELALARLLQLTDSTDNLKQALAIYTQLRTRAAKEKVHTPCDVKETELGLGSCFIAMGRWQQFDELQLEKRQFSGFEPQLLLSLRFFSETLGVVNISPEHLTLLGKALSHAALAAEISAGSNASCLSQLAHCFRLLSCWPPTMLRLWTSSRKNQPNSEQGPTVSLQRPIRSSPTGNNWITLNPGATRSRSSGRILRSKVLPLSKQSLRFLWTQEQDASAWRLLSFLFMGSLGMDARLLRVPDS